MKFSQMKYERPDAERLKAELNGLTEKLKAAKSYTEAKELFLAEEKLNKHISTLANLAHIRHTIDTRDAFYDGEMKFWNKVDPELEECQQGWTQAMLESPYRKDFAEEYGNLMFLKAEIKCKTFSPVIIEELQKENELADEYEKLLASAQIPFEGGVYTLLSSLRLRVPRTMPVASLHGKPRAIGTKKTRLSWMIFTINWCICVIKWAKSWAMKVIPRWDTTAWAATATPRKM